MNSLAWDLTMAWRSLRRTPGFLAVTVAILSLGIGASTTMFSAIDSVLLRALPYREPERLVAMWESNSTEQVRAGVSAGTFSDWKETSKSFEGMAAYRPWGFVLTGEGAAERLTGARVSANLFSLLGVAPALGRSFRVEEGESGAARSVMVSEALWRRRFGGDSSLVGRTIRLDGDPATVVGIVPQGYSLPAADVWVPLVFAPYELAQRGARALSVVARLRPRVTLAAAQSELDGVARTIEQNHPEVSSDWGARVIGLQQELIGDTRTPLLLLFTATIALMLVACGNLGNLLLTRSTVRVKEMALRSALGGHRARLIRQLLCENLILVMIAGAIGFALAALGADLLTNFAPKSLLRTEVQLNPSAFGFAAMTALTVGLLLGLIPIAGLNRIDLGGALRSVGGQPAPGQRITLRDLLLVGQVAVAMILLVGGTLLVRSLAKAQSIEPGFSATGVTTATISLPGSKYQLPDQKLAFYQAATERVGAIAGVERVALASHLPLAAGPLLSDFATAGANRWDPANQPRAQLVVVSPEYFESMGIQLLKGRRFEAPDRLGSPPVVLVDATLAQRTWPGVDPVGQYIRVGAGLGADTTLKEVIGVVGPVRSLSLERDPEPMIYLPYAQTPWPTMNLVVRSNLSPDQLGPLLSGAVTAIDPDQPVYNVRSVEQTVDRALSYRRFQATLLGGFAVSALLLAVLGVYGVLAFDVARRTRELGIRAALGATRERIVAGILGQAAVRVGAGLLIGSLVAVGTGRLLASMLFDVSPVDPLAFGAACVLLLLAGMGAAYVPARRAMAVDPVEALREQA